MRGKMIQDSKPVLRAKLAEALAQLAAESETGWRLCVWSGLIGCGLTAFVMWAVR